jgi:hypothetical protein
MIDAEKEEEEEAHSKIKYKLTLKDFVIQHQVLNNRSLKDFRLRKKFVCYEGEGTTVSAIWPCAPKAEGVGSYGKLPRAGA